MTFERDPAHWLLRLSPREWVRLGIEELERAEIAFTGNQTRAAYVGAKRAAGMALNGALIVAPNDAWGRSYVDHLNAVAADESLPTELRDAARKLTTSEPPGGAMVTLRSRSGEQRLIDAARTVMAHAYTIVIKSEPVDSISKGNATKAGEPIEERLASSSKAAPDATTADGLCDAPGDEPATAPDTRNP